ncbi:MAG: ankyrin repeat domain-containing protein [Thermonemataceae bacterium]
MWHYLDDATNTFHAEDILPNALYHMEVTDAKYIAHLEKGDAWETASCDLWGASWYLEYKSTSTAKFYHLYLDDVGRWTTHYGKIGTKGRKEFLAIRSRETAKKRVEAKLKKGYVMVYQNYDTAFGYEEEHAVQVVQPAATFDKEALLEAVQNNDIAVIKSLLENGVDLNDYEDEYGNYLASKCLKYNRRGDAKIEIATARFLLENGMNPNYATENMSIAHELIQNGDEALLKLFLDFGLDITLEDPGALACAAAEQGYIWLLEMARAKGIDVINAKVDHVHFANGFSALHFAARGERNTFATIDYLLENGADLNYNAPRNWGTPLLQAATGGMKEVVDYLIAKGADIHLKNKVGENALHAAARFGEAAVFSSLLAHGADYLIPTDAGAYAGQLLLIRMVGINEKRSQQSFDKLKILLEKGESFERLNVLPLKPLTFLGENITKKKRLKPYEERIILELIEAGLDPSLQDKQGRNLLHFAAKLNLAEVVKKCLALKVSTKVKDKKQMTPRDYAERSKANDCLPLL